MLPLSFVNEDPVSPREGSERDLLFPNSLVNEDAVSSWEGSEPDLLPHSFVVVDVVLLREGSERDLPLDSFVHKDAESRVTDTVLDFDLVPQPSVKEEAESPCEGSESLPDSPVSERTDSLSAS